MNHINKKTILTNYRINFRTVIISLLVLFAINFFCQPADCTKLSSKIDIFGPVAFSPDGKWLAISVREGNNSFLYKLAWQDTKSDLIRLTRATHGYEIEPAFSPDGQRIVYAYDRKSGGQALNSKLFVLDLDTNKTEALAISDCDRDCDPVFSEDGKKIYFIRQNYPTGKDDEMNKFHQQAIGVYCANLDGSSLKSIFYRGANCLSLSPDGTKLAFMSGGSTLVKRDGKNIAQAMLVIILSGEKFKTILALGPQLTELHNEEHDWSLSKADTYGAALAIGYAGLSCPVFMPDGKEILFLRDNVDDPRPFAKELYSMNLQTRQFEKLPIASIVPIFLTVSPDGSSVVFVGQEMDAGNSRGNIYVMDLKTKQVRALL